MTAGETFTHRGLNVRIEYDTDPESPREWDNLGTMVCWHRRYTLGDKHCHAEPDDFFKDLLDGKTLDRLERWSEREMAKLESLHGDPYFAAAREHSKAFAERVREEADKVAIILPLYLYDHSGITMSCKPFSCPWDSGQVGYIYVTLADVRKEYSVRAVSKKVREQAVKCLQGEVSTYDDFLTGQVYGYVVETEEGEHLDSCWGFYGLDYCREEAKSAADSHAEDADEATATEATEREFWARQDVVTVDA